MLKLEESLKAINHGCGYSIGNLTHCELEELRAMVSTQFLQVIEANTPQNLASYREAGLENYHKVYAPEHFEHGKIWCKKARIFDNGLAQKALQFKSLRHITSSLGEVLISDEEKLQHPNLYWRLVRPGNSDIGPVHADKWFWDLGHGDMPEGYDRLKIWIALHSVPGESGLRVVPGSQSRSDWKYHGERRGDMIKPVLDEDERKLDLLNLPLGSGQFVLFHDALLHGGMPNLSDKTRVSLEFTLLVKQANGKNETIYE